MISKQEAVQVKGYSAKATQAGGARDDLAFCLPVAVSLGHADWARVFVWLSHLCTFVIVLLTLDGLPGAVTAVAVVVSLLACLRQQNRLSGFDALDCDQFGQWSLLDRDGDRQWVRLAGLGMAGPFCLLRLKRFGSSVFWISSERYQTIQTWRRLRVLTRLL